MSHTLSINLFFSFVLSKRKTTNTKVSADLRIIVENIERYGGEFGNSSAIIKYVLGREGHVSKDEYKNWMMILPYAEIGASL